MRVLAAIACAVTLICLGVAPGHAEKRVALVIGNSSYRNVPVLPNPSNDAADIAASFGRLGFSVTKVVDGTFDDMRRALLQFGRDTRGAEMAVVFFAGHGMEIGGENWLIPVDAELRSDNDAEGEAIPLRSAMLQVANASSLGLVILDACRNNPFAAKMQRSVRYRAVDRGLARIEPTDNVLVAYASRAGTTADDGSGRNSPFTAALLNNLETPGLEVAFLFRAVRDEVMAATKHEQQPFVYGSLSRQAIYLKAPSPKAEEARAPAVQTPPTTSEAERAWLEVKGSNSQAVLEAFVRRYGDSFYADVARDRIEELKKKQLAVASPEPVLPSAAVTHRVMLNEVDPAERFAGTVVWRTETVSPGAGLAPELAVRADVEIPGRKMKMTWSLRRNTDKALPASHTIELMFTLPPDFPSGGIADVRGILMRSAEQGRGMPLFGLSVKVINNFFLIGLSSVEDEIKRNTDLLKERSWFDVPIIYSNGRHAVLAMEKGPQGERAFNEAFAAWGEPVPTLLQKNTSVGYLVQVASQRSEADALASFRSLKTKYADVIGVREPVIRRADLGEKGIYYRVMVGGFTTPQEAEQFCGSLKAAGGSCLIEAARN